MPNHSNIPSMNVFVHEMKQCNKKRKKNQNELHILHVNMLTVMTMEHARLFIFYHF